MKRTIKVRVQADDGRLGGRLIPMKNAEVFGRWAANNLATRSLDGRDTVNVNHWTVTHVPTGYRMPFVGSKGEAVFIARRASRLTSARTVEGVAKHKDSIMALISEAQSNDQ